MSDPTRDPLKLPVTLEPVPGDALRYRLSVELTAEDLAQLIEPYLDLARSRKTALRRKRSNQKRHDKAAHDVRERSLALGKAISEAVEANRASGMDSYPAIKAAAIDRKLSPSAAQHLMVFYRDTKRRERDQKILQLHKQTWTAREIADRLSISPSTAAKVIKEAQAEATSANPSLPTTRSSAETAHGAIEGSRPFSGDRAPKARRKGLDATEAPSRSSQGSGREEGGEADPSSPAPLPVGETRGCGGQAPTTDYENEETTDV